MTSNIKMDPQLMGTPPFGESSLPPPQAEVNDFLRKKRKAREHKACYPCRRRKVKCDLSRPCQTCKSRDHPELCSYHPPSKRQNVDGVAPGGSLRVTDDDSQGTPIHVPQDRGYVTLERNAFDLLCHKLNGLENSIADLRREIRRNSDGDHVGVQEKWICECCAKHGVLMRRSGMVHRTNIDALPMHISVNLAGDNPIHPSHSPPIRREAVDDFPGRSADTLQGEIVHLGGGSVPAMIYAISQGHPSSGAEQTQLQEFLGKSVLPLFGLDNESATYPFVDLWGLPHGSLQRARELSKALPGDAQMLSLFHSYRDMGHIIYPSLADLNQLEKDLAAFLADRSSLSNPDDGVTENTIHGRSFYWLGMLFAVLASGAQCSALTRKERELTSQVYVCCGFECLRFTNFLSQPHLESIQALLIIGNVMTNNMNAGTAWSLLGLTIRLAQGLGLHQACPPDIPTEKVLPRSRIWWAIIWQDSLLSITYDRKAALDVNTMPMPQHFGPVSSYHAAMYRMSRLALDIIRDRAKPSSSREHVAMINQHRDEISSIMRDAVEHLRDSRQCNSSRETLEHWALYLHTSYAMSELCRPAVSPSTSSEIVKSFRPVCIENLVNTVEAFLGLNNITFFARQSWAAVHRGLSSALLLGILGVHRHNDRARKLMGRFVTLMSQITSTVDPTEVSGPVQRGIEALRKLNIGDDQSGTTFAESLATPMDSSTSVDANGELKVDHSQIFTPSNSDTSREDFSPYSVLNTILWGNNAGAISNGETAPM